MRGFLVRGRSGGVPVDFHQDKTGGIVCLLADIEPGDARLSNAGGGIGDRGGFEGLDELGLYLHVNMNDQHGGVGGVYGEPAGVGEGVSVFAAGADGFDFTQSANGSPRR